MPWRERSPVDERREFALAAMSRRRSTSTLCRQYGISRKTGCKWLRIAREQGLRSLDDRSRRPHRIRRIDREIERRILELRQSSGEGGRFISEALLEEGIRVGHATVDRVIARAGLGPSKSRLRSAPQRFERAHPNELWQVDFKAEYRVGDGRVVPLTILDDHSRYLVGLYGLASLEQRETQAAIRNCFEQYGLPDAMLMDHGPPWWGTKNGFGLTRLAVELIEQDIALLYSGIRHPQTQGKVERCHRTLERRLSYAQPFARRRELIEALSQFRQDYNHRRRHTALDRQVPASRYTPSSRCYVATPRRWEYPDGGQLRKLNRLGMLWLGGQRFFVSESLAEKEVWCRTYGDRVLVTYRNMYVREIDRRTGSTYPVVTPVEPR